MLVRQNEGGDDADKDPSLIRVHLQVLGHEVGFVMIG